MKYKDHPVGKGRVDLLVEKSTSVELKVVEDLAPIHPALTISSLRASNRRLDLLMNFNVTKLKDGRQRIMP